MKTVYQLDADGFLVGATQADQDPLVPGRWLIPGGCVEVVPPTVGAGQVARYDGAVWALLPDRRGEKYWLPDGSEHEIVARGEVPPLGALSDIPIESVKEAKEVEINKKRDQEVLQNVVVDGKTWKAGQIDQWLLANAISRASRGKPLPAFWRTEDNVNVPITNIKQLEDIEDAIAAQTEAAYINSWTKKAQLAALSDREAIKGL